MLRQLTLEQARKLSGLSRKEVGQRIQVDMGTVRNWEIGKTVPDAKQFAKLCQLYGVALSDIFLL